MTTRHIWSRNNTLKAPKKLTLWTFRGGIPRGELTKIAFLTPRYHEHPILLYMGIPQGVDVCVEISFQPSIPGGDSSSEPFPSQGVFQSDPIAQASLKWKLYFLGWGLLAYQYTVESPVATASPQRPVF